MEFRTVALIGAGAIGGYFIRGLSGSMGNDFMVVAEGERRERLLREGIVINGEHFPLHVQTPQQAHGADLLLVATKYAGLSSALSEIRTVTDDHTIVISLLNGVDSEEIIATAIPERQIVNAFMKISSMRTEAGIVFDPEVTIGMIFGEKSTPEKTERCEAIEAFFADKPVRTTFVSDIMKLQWMKFARNISMNLPQAILGVGIGAYEDSRYLLTYSRKLEDEVRTVAAAYGYPMEPLKRPHMGYRKASRYSTLQDLDAGRHTEIEMFCGVLMKKAAAKDISVPYAEGAYYLIKTLEEKNDGKFDYSEDET